MVDWQISAICPRSQARCQLCGRPRQLYGNRDPETQLYGNRDQETGWAGWCSICNWQWRFGNVETQRMLLRGKYLLDKIFSVDAVVNIVMKCLGPGKAIVDLNRQQHHADLLHWIRHLFAKEIHVHIPSDQGRPGFIMALHHDLSVSDEEPFEYRFDYINKLWTLRASRNRPRLNEDLSLVQEATVLDIIVDFLGSPICWVLQPNVQMADAVADRSTGQDGVQRSPMQHCKICNG